MADDAEQVQLDSGERYPVHYLVTADYPPGWERVMIGVPAETAARWRRIEAEWDTMQAEMADAMAAYRQEHPRKPR